MSNGRTNECQIDGRKNLKWTDEGMSNGRTNVKWREEVNVKDGRAPEKCRLNVKEMPEQRGKKKNHNAVLLVVH